MLRVNELAARVVEVAGGHDQRSRALAAFAVALALALVLAPLAARIASRLGLVDRPGGRRIHITNVPLGGGVALTLAVLAPSLLLLPSIPDGYRALLIGAVLACLLGLVDDCRPLSPPVKLAGMVAIAAIPVSQGVTVDHFTLPIVDPFSLGVWQYPVTILWIVLLMNVVNFVDGMDGLAAGIGVISGGTFAILSLSLGRVDAAIIGAALCGACLGFLPSNFHPARIFMGDSGALMLGFVLATVSVQGVLKTAAAVAIAFPLLVLFVPILDTSFVVLKRLKYHQPPWQADANHLHHRFAGVGWGQRQASILLYAWCAALAGFALAVHFVHYRTHGNWHPGATVLLDRARAAGAGVHGVRGLRARDPQAAPRAAARPGARARRDRLDAARGHAPRPARPDRRRARRQHRELLEDELLRPVAASSNSRSKPGLTWAFSSSGSSCREIRNSSGSPRVEAASAVMRTLMTSPSRTSDSSPP